MKYLKNDCKLFERQVVGHSEIWGVEYQRMLFSSYDYDSCIVT